MLKVSITTMQLYAQIHTVAMNMLSGQKFSLAPIGLGIEINWRWVRGISRMYLILPFQSDGHAIVDFSDKQTVSIIKWQIKLCLIADGAICSRQSAYLSCSYLLPEEFRLRALIFSEADSSLKDVTGLELLRCFILLIILGFGLLSLLSFQRYSEPPIPPPIPEKTTFDFSFLNSASLTTIFA